VTQWLPPILCMDAVKSHMQTAPPGTYSVRLSLPSLLLSLTRPSECEGLHLSNVLNSWDSNLFSWIHSRNDSSIPSPWNYLPWI
jgi:hypothetical protein